MRAFLVWLVMATVGFGGLGGYWHLRLTEEPRRVLVVVDASFPMAGDWNAVGPWLRDVAQKRYADFALFTDKGKVHGWKSTIDLGTTRPYAPRSLDRILALEGVAEFGQATERILITNAPLNELKGWSDWRVIRP